MPDVPKSCHVVLPRYVLSMSEYNGGLRQRQSPARTHTRPIPHPHGNSRLLHSCSVIRLSVLWRREMESPPDFNERDKPPIHVQERAEKRGNNTSLIFCVCFIGYAHNRRYKSVETHKPTCGLFHSGPIAPAPFKFKLSLCDNVECAAKPNLNLSVVGATGPTVF